jgi:hypothetical protein
VYQPHPEEKQKKRILATLALGATLALSLSGVAEAKATDVRATGACTGASTAKIRLSPGNGRIETDFEVDQNKVGQRWDVTISDNGVVVARTIATTTAPSGSFTVRRLIANRAGTDRIAARATNPATGESCAARASI